MPRISPKKCVELLEGLHTMTTVCWELSKNPELTENLEQMKSVLERMINTIQNTLLLEEKNS
jgi:hypothetical protein